LSATAAFGLFEVWPRSLPQWLQRWALQVVTVGALMPVTTLLIYVLSTPQSAPPFWRDPDRMNGWTHLTFAAILLAPWTALAAVVRQKEAFARDQKMAFALERSEIERQLQLVRPYLELMQMRMPDRLQYAMNVDQGALNVRCPPTTVLTLVENAVRHGIDPSEEGGRIDIDIERRGERCVVRVTDTG